MEKQLAFNTLQVYGFHTVAILIESLLKNRFLTASWLHPQVRFVVPALINNICYFCVTVTYSAAANLLAGEYKSCLRLLPRPRKEHFTSAPVYAAEIKRLNIEPRFATNMFTDGII